MIALRACRELSASPDQLVALVVDPGRWLAFEPRLRSAAWLTKPPIESGSRLRIEAHLPYRISVAQFLLGQPIGVIDVLAWDPPIHARLQLNTRLAVGTARIDVAPLRTGSVVTIAGTIRPHSRLAFAALAPMRALLQRRATASLEHALERLDGALN